MPDVNLSKLSGSELRRLLDATRARGNATLAYQILQEMAARREVRGRPAFAAKRPAEPRIIAVDLGDPLEPVAEPPPEPERSAPPAQPEPVAGSAPRRPRGAKTPPSPIAAAPKSSPKSARPSSVEPTPAPAPRPRSVWDDDPLPEEEVESKDRGLRLHPPSLAPARAALARRRVPGAGFAVGIVVGVGVGWWVADRREPPPAAPAAPAATLQIAAPDPLPAPIPAPVAATAAEPAPTPETPAAPPVEPLPDLGADIPSPDATEVATEPTEAPTAPADACAAEPTPADRKICGDPELQRLQRELRQAYAEALEAHADRGLLRQRQLAWADARNTVTDPGRLAQLYEERIRKLNAAAAAAREQR